MRGVTGAVVLLGGLAACGLLLSPTVKAADLEPAIEEPALLWYVSLFGGPKWAHSDIKLDWERENDCTLSSLVCVLQPLVTHDGRLRGEIDDGFIVGGILGAKLSENFRGEIEVSGARLETESKALEYASYGSPPLGSSYKAEDDDYLHELFILANAWVDFQLSSMFCTYLGGGAGVVHVDSDFGVDPFVTGGAAASPDFSASLEGDDWAFAYQLGAGLLIGLSKHVGLDVGYRFKSITNVELDDPEFCGRKGCHPPVVDTRGDNVFDLHEHVTQIGLIFTF